MTAIIVGMATVISGSTDVGFHPPHPGAVWVAHRWNHRDRGYALVEALAIT